MEKIFDIAIVGAEPAGIATAIENYIFGLKDILLLEKADNHSTTIRNFYNFHITKKEIYRIKTWSLPSLSLTAMP